MTKPARYIEVILDTEMGDFTGVFHYIADDIDTGVHNMELQRVTFEGLDVSPVVSESAIDRLRDLAYDEVYG